MSQQQQSRPNLLILLGDELRTPPPYEKTLILEKWRRDALVAQQRLRDTGTEFLQHYIASAACCPSRATIFTGQYGTLSGINFTDGAAKSEFDPDMFFLDPNTVPTLGDYLRLSGYETYYLGKFHIGQVNILTPGTKAPVTSYDAQGVPIPREVRLYKEANRLAPFGFQGWVGPEPHGTNPRDSGSSAAQGLNGRDVVYTKDAIDLLEKLGQRSPREHKPWCLVVSLLGTHDQALLGQLTAKMTQQFNFDIDPSVPPVPRAPTAEENLRCKPRCQRDYREKYQEAFQPTEDTEDFRRFYYSLQLNLDRNMTQVLDALERSGQEDSTVVLFTSDHGDTVGAHGLFQKWYNAYQEVLHVQCLLRIPPAFRPLGGRFRLPRKVDLLTSHIDLMPTLLSLAQVDVQAVRRQLQSSHNEARRLVGRDLTPLLFEEKKSLCLFKEANILFITSDDVLSGLNQIGWNGQPYSSVVQPNSIQTLVTWLDGNLWKYSRYYDQTAENQFDSELNGSSDEKKKKKKIKEEFELYNLSKDPLEEHNLLCCHSEKKSHESEAIAAKLSVRLREEVQRKCLVPKPQGRYVIAARKAGQPVVPQPS